MAETEDNKDKVPETDNQPERRKYNVKGQVIEATDDEVARYLEAGANYGSYVAQLRQQGIIDEAGNVLVKEKIVEKEKEPELDREELLDRKIKELEERQNRLHTDREVEKILNKTNKLLELCAQQHELTKEDDDIRNMVETQVLANFQNNPNVDIRTEYDKAVKKFEKTLSKRDQNYLTNKVKQAINKGEGPGGSSPMAVDKPYSGKDMQSGAVREALIQRLNKLAEIG